MFLKSFPARPLKAARFVAMAMAVAFLSGRAQAVPGVSATIDVAGGLRGFAPSAMAINPGTNRLYIVNRDSGNLSVVDTGSLKVRGTVAVGGSPSLIAVNAATNTIFITSGGTLLALSGQSNRIVATIPPLSSGESIVGIALSTALNRIYLSVKGASGGDVLRVLNGVGGGVLGNLPAPDIAGVAIDDARKRALVVSGARLRIFDPRRGTLLSNLPLSETGGQIAINSPANRIYVANAAGTKLLPISGVTGQELPGRTLAQGTGAPVVNPQTGRIYLPNRQSGMVSVLDGATLDLIATVGGSPSESVAIDVERNRFFVSNPFLNGVSAYNGADNTLIRIITVGAVPYFDAVNPVTKKIYVSDVRRGGLNIIDGPTNSVVSTVGVPFALGLDVNSSSNTIFVSSFQPSGRLYKVDGATNTLVGSVAVGTSPVGVAVNRATNRVYVANTGSNTISVVDGGSLTVLDTIAVGANAFPQSVAVNINTNRIYVGNATAKTISVINGATNAIIDTINIGGVTDVEVDSVRNRVYAAVRRTSTGAGGVEQEEPGLLRVINASTNTITTSIDIGENPNGVAVNAVANRIYVSNSNDNTVSVINGSDYQVNATVPVRMYPFGMAAFEDGSTLRAYAVNVFDATVSVISDSPGVDNTAPALQYLSPQDDGSYPSLEEFTLQVTEADSGLNASGVLIVLYRYARPGVAAGYFNGTDFSSSSPVLLATTALGGGVYKFAAPALPPGDYATRAQAIDRAGNKGQTSVISFKITGAAPAPSPGDSGPHGS